MSFTAFTHTYTYVHYHHRGEYNKFWLYWWHSWKVACTDFEIEFTTFEYFLFDDDRKIHEQHRKNVAWAFQYEIHLLNIDRFRRNFWKVPNLIGFRDLTKPIDSTHTQMKRHQMLIALFFRINKNISNNRYQSCPRFSFRSSHSFIQLEFWANINMNWYLLKWRMILLFRYDFVADAFNIRNTWNWISDAINTIVCVCVCESLQPATKHQMT